MERVLKLLSRISFEILGIEFKINAYYDQKYTKVLSNGDEMYGRIYLQASYYSPCTNTGDVLEWKGRKNYLSDHMTDDEIVKTAYVAFKQAVEHEVMEGFKIDGVILFNPHINFEELLKVSHLEVKRERNHL